MGTEPGTELGTGLEIELGTEPIIELGTEPGIEPGTEQGTDPGIELLNNKSHGLSPPGVFSSLSYDQEVPYYAQRHLANLNAIYILH